MCVGSTRAGNGEIRYVACDAYEGLYVVAFAILAKVNLAGKVTGISQVSEKSEVMLISQYGKIIRIESKTIRESGRSAQGVRLLHMEPGDRVAAAVVIPPDEEVNGGLIQ